MIPQQPFDDLTAANKAIQCFAWQRQNRQTRGVAPDN
jgi:hypothetical protein